MFEVEDNHWWYVGNHEIFVQLLQKHNILQDDIEVLDAGCGTGKWLEILKSLNRISETGIDYQEIALDYAKTRGNLNLKIGDINKPLFPEASFNLITSFDVICNTNVNDPLALQHFHNWLKKDGYVLTTVPAYQFLLSKHDAMVHQNKRYRKKQVRKLMEENGFEIVSLSYCVCLLFPMALIKRTLDKLFSSKDTDHNEVKMPGKLMNSLFLSVMRFEKFLFRFTTMSFGLSVLVLARKKS